MPDIELQELVINEAESDEIVEKQTDLNPNQIIVTPTGASGIDYYGLPVGSIFASAIPVVDARVHLLDGSLITQSGIYAEFATLIKTLVSSGQPISCTQAEFTADVARTGNCGKFVIDDANNAIRLPKITTFIQGLSSIANIGSSLSAGLPNITGQIGGMGNRFFVNENSGAFSNNTDKANDANTIGPLGQTYSMQTYYGAKFDANAGADVKGIYGNSNTVQPQATQFPYYIVLASGYKQQSQLDVDNIMNDVNGLAGQFEQKPWLLDVYPVGSIVLTLNEYGSPASIFGGTWEKIKDCFLWASGDTTSITYTENGTSVTKSLLVGKRGGEINHKLIESEIPSHTHSLTWCWEKTGNYYVTLTANGTASTTLYDNRSSGATGGNAVHNNMPPYLAVNMYKRIPD